MHKNKESISSQIIAERPDRMKFVNHFSEPRSLGSEVKRSQKVFNGWAHTHQANVIFQGGVKPKTET